MFVSDILTGLWSGKLFGKRKPLCEADKYSQVFKDQFIAFGINENEKMNDFLNKTFNHLNFVITEFRVALKELVEKSLLEPPKKQSVLMYDLSCKLLKVIEIMSLTCPQMFLCNELNMVRLAELILGVTSTTSRIGPYSSMISFFFSKITKRKFFISYFHQCYPICINYFLFLSLYLGISKTSVHFEFKVYGPVCGILVSLFNHENRQHKIEKTLARVDGAKEATIFKELGKFPWNEAKQTREEALHQDLPHLHQFIDCLDKEYIHNASSVSDDEDDDNVCSICYSNPIDTLFIPCNHSSCKQYV